MKGPAVETEQLLCPFVPDGFKALANVRAEYTPSPYVLHGRPDNSKVMSDE